MENSITNNIIWQFLTEILKIQLIIRNIMSAFILLNPRCLKVTIFYMALLSRLHCWTVLITGTIYNSSYYTF